METRLAILADAGVIDADVHQRMHKVVERLEQHWRLSIRNEQGTLLLIHMANAVMRVRRGEPVQGIDSLLWAELTALDEFPLIQNINQDVMSCFSEEMPASELGYLLVNVAGLLQQPQQQLAD